MDRTALNLIPAIVLAVAGVVVQRVERKLRQPIPMNSPGLPLTGIHIWRLIHGCASRASPRLANAATCAGVPARAVVPADAGAQAAVSHILKQPQCFVQRASDQARVPMHGSRSARSRSATLRSTGRPQ